MGDAHPQDGSQLLLQQPKSNVLHKPSPLNISPDQLQAPTGKDAQTIFSPGVETPGHKLPFHLDSKASTSAPSAPGSKTGCFGSCMRQ